MRINNDRLRSILVSAGWSEARDVTEIVQPWIAQLTNEGYQPNSAAVAALKEFGGLTVAQSGPGESVARQTFSFDPLVATGEREYVATFETSMGSTLFPLGEAENGVAMLFMSDDQRVVLIMNAAWVIGHGIEEALATLVFGRKGSMVSE